MVALGWAAVKRVERVVSVMNWAVVALVAAVMGWATVALVVAVME